jgi:hypothetical protein
MKRLLALFALAVSAFAAGSVQQTISQLGTSGNWVIAFSWTGDSVTGSVPVTAAKLAGCCQGYLITQVETVPGTSTPPTPGYSVKITDVSGLDLLAGAAAGLSSAIAQAFQLSSSPLNGTLSLTISGQSVASATGTVFVFISQTSPTVSVNTVSANGANWLTLTNPPFLDIRSYGAKVDGVTDDTAADQAAINAAGVLSAGGAGATVYFPPGLSKISSPLTYSGGNVRITGCGPKCGGIYQATANLDGIQLNAIAVEQHNQIDNIQIVGQASSTSGSAINASQQTQLNLQNIYILAVSNGVTLNSTVTFSGFLNRLQNITCETLNGGSCVNIAGAATNGIFLDSVISNSAYASCRAGVLVISSGNTSIANSSFFGCVSGIELAPTGTNQVFSTDIANTYMDSLSSFGLYLNPAAGASVIRTRCDSCWCHAASEGVRVIATGTVKELSIVNPHVLLNGANGINILGGTSISITGGMIANNGAGSGIAIGSGVTDVNISGVKIGNNFEGDAGGTQAYGIFFGGVPTGSSITGNSFIGNATAPITFAGGSNYSGITFSGNQGLDDLWATAASAANLQLPYTGAAAGGVPNVYITGTTAIQSMFGGFAGRQYRLQFTNASPAGIASGGLFYTAKTVTQNQMLLCTWDGTGWACVGP